MSMWRATRPTEVDNEQPSSEDLTGYSDSGSDSDSDDHFGLENGANRRSNSTQNVPSTCNGLVAAASGSAGKDHLLSGKSKNMQNLRFRAKKNLVGRIGSRNSLRPLIGRRASACLKAFEDLAKLHIREQEEQKRLFQSIVKSLGKLGVIAKQSNLSEERMETARRLKQELRVIAMVVCTFTRTQFTYDREYLVKQVTNCEQNLQQCVSGLLSEKSTARLHYIFGVLKRERLLDGIFSPVASAAQRDALVKFVDSIEKTLDLSAATTSSLASSATAAGASGSARSGLPQHR